VLVLREVVIDVDALELGFNDIESWEGIGVRDAKLLSWRPGIWRVSPKSSRNRSEKESNIPGSNPESGSISNSKGR
jgi:hypothetical protein